MTTGGFNSNQLLEEALLLKLHSLTNLDTGENDLIATTLGKQRIVPITVQVRIGDWVVYRAFLRCSKPENNWWINRKVAVVMLKHHSIMYEPASAEEREVDWNKENNLRDETHASHGGALPLITR